MTDIRRELPDVYPVAVAEYIGPQSAALLKRNGLGYLDLSGNCYLVVRQCADRERGQAEPPAVHAPAEVALRAPSDAGRPCPPGRSPARVAARGACQGGRGEPRARPQRGEAPGAALLGAARRAPAHPAVEGRATCSTPGSTRTRYRLNESGTYFSPERITRKLVGDIARVAQAEGRRYAFTLHSGAALVAPNVRLPAIHCYVEGDPEPIARALGLRPGDGEGNVHLMTPTTRGVSRPDHQERGAGGVAAPALRRPVSLRAPGPRAGGPSTARSHGLLSAGAPVASGRFRKGVS